MKEINLYWRKEIEAQLKQIRQQAYRLYRRYDPVYMVTQVHYGALHFPLVITTRNPCKITSKKA